MMSRCHFCLRRLIALFAVLMVTAATSTSPSGTVTNTTVASTASKDGSTSVSPSAAPATTPLPSNSTESTTASAITMNVSAVTSTMQAATTASTPTQLTTTIAADGVNTTTGSVSVTKNGNTTTPWLSQGTATTAPLDTTAGPQNNTSPNTTAGPQNNTSPNTTAGPQNNTTTSPNSTAGPQWTTTMHTSPATPEMTSRTGAPSSAVPTNPSITVTNSTFTPQTESTTTTQTPTTTAISIVSTLSPNMAGLFVLRLTVGSNLNITCLGTCDAENIRNLTTLAFYGKSGFYDVRIVSMTNRQKREVTPVRVMLEVRFIASILLELPMNNVSQMVKSALQQLNVSGSVIINGDIMDTIANDFALTSRNVCQAVGVCALGYVCQLRSGRAACYHLCDEDSTWSCGQHGTCQVHVMEGQAHKSCKCDSDYDNVWSGDKCQDSEISGEKKARIAGGVLGAFCGVFIIIIIVLLVLRGGCCGATSSQKTYQLGVSNAGYSDICMQKL